MTSSYLSSYLLPRRDVSRGLLGLLGTCLLGEPVAASEQKSGSCQAQADRAPWAEFGINIAGPAMAPGTRGTYGKDYIYPDDATLAYYRSKGFKTVRVTFLWERLQPKLFATLATDELKRLQDLVNAVRRQDMVLITGPHNYARYAVEDGKPELIGTPAVPRAAFVDLWRRLSDVFAPAQDGLIFTLMNEPHDTGGSWPLMAQAAVDAIRERDKKRWIYVPGDGWSSARSWGQHNKDLAINDRSDRIVYVAHQYFDASGQGSYKKTYDEDAAYPEIGVERLKPFLAWLRNRGVRGTVTEYGVPNNDPRWLVVLDNTLAALSEANVGGAYWAGGPWWGDYPLSSEPRDGHDAPVMAVLSKYASQCSASRPG
jgi:endoglucanase